MHNWEFLDNLGEKMTGSDGETAKIIIQAIAELAGIPEHDVLPNMRFEVELKEHGFWKNYDTSEFFRILRDAKNERLIQILDQFECHSFWFPASYSVRELLLDLFYKQGSFLILRER